MEEDDEFRTMKGNAGSNIIVFRDVVPCSLGQISHDISLYPPQGDSPRYPSDGGGWVGPRIGMSALEVRKIPSPRRYFNHDTSIIHSIV